MKFPRFSGSPSGDLKLKRFVDEHYYLSVYPDVYHSGLTASDHFCLHGWREGRNPSHVFNTIWYMNAYGSDITPGQNPLVHFSQRIRSGAPIPSAPAEGDDTWRAKAEKNPLVPELARVSIRDYNIIAGSRMFDADFYRARYSVYLGDPIDHYYRFGWLLGYDPSAFFSTQDYLNLYLDVRKASINPLVHYLVYGRKEGRVLRRDTTNGDHHLYCPAIDIHRAATCDDIESRLGPPKIESIAFKGPIISVLTPVYNVSENWLRQMVQSVLQQSYQNWQLCLVDDASTDTTLQPILREIAARDDRIVVRFREHNGGISAATNDCLELAVGEYVALIDNDDMITNDALEVMARAILDHGSPDWLYSNECKIDESNRASELFAKPDWSPLMLLNYMYTGHLSLYSAKSIRQLGGFRSEYDFSQDYDLALRLSEKPGVRVVHLPEYLYCWRMIASSASMGGKPKARATNLAALQNASDRRGWGGRVIPLSTANRLIRAADERYKVSIVIPSDNIDNILAAIHSISELSDYKNYEIIVVTNSNITDALEEEMLPYRIVWCRYDKPFNFSDKCNEGADLAVGAYIVFFNDDVRVLSRDWMQALLELLTLPGVGIVGPKLLYEDGRIQHAGMATGMRRLVGTAFHCYPANTSAHFNFAQCVRNVSLICGALLAMPLELFKRIGGYDAVNTPINHSDVDLCFRVREAGYTCAYTPYATLRHIGHVSLAVEDERKPISKKDKAEIFLLRRWARYVAYDPYFPPPLRNLVYIDSPERFELFDQKTPQGGRDILILSHDLTASGAPKVAFDMACMFHAQGDFVTVISPSDGVYRRMLQNRGINVIVDELILEAHDASLNLARNFDVVIGNTILCWRAIGALASATDVYLYAHETELVRHFFNIYPGFRDALSKAKSIWCGSSLPRDAMSALGLDAHILEYGVDDAAAAPFVKPLVIAMFGTFEPRKGQDLAVLGMAGVPKEVRSLARLKIYGRTNDQVYHEKVVQIANPFEQIQIFSDLHYEDYKVAMNEADVVLITSRDDTLPLVSLDALALGKPLIISRTTGTSKYLVDSVSGRILKHNSPHEISLAITELIGDSELRWKLGRGGRAVFEERFTYAAFAQRLKANIWPVAS